MRWCLYPHRRQTKAGIRIKRVPDDHRALLAFCQAVQNHFKLKLTYCGEGNAVLCHKLIQLLLVRRRETISDEDAQYLLDVQENRCC